MDDPPPVCCPCASSPCATFDRLAAATCAADSMDNPPVCYPCALRMPLPADGCGGRSFCRELEERRHKNKRRQ